MSHVVYHTISALKTRDETKSKRMGNESATLGSKFKSLPRVHNRQQPAHPYEEEANDESIYGRELELNDPRTIQGLCSSFWDDWAKHQLRLQIV